MIKTLLTVAVLGSVGCFATLAVAQGKQGEAIGSDVSSRAKLEAQCAHRRIMPPDPRDDCARQLRDAQVGYGGGSASSSSYSHEGPINPASQCANPSGTSAARQPLLADKLQAQKERAAKCQMLRSVATNNSSTSLQLADGWRGHTYNVILTGG